MQIHPKTRIPLPLSRNHGIITIYLSPRENTIQTHVWIAQAIHLSVLWDPFCPRWPCFAIFRESSGKRVLVKASWETVLSPCLLCFLDLALGKALITRKGVIDQLIINSTLQKKLFCNRALSGRSSIKGVAGSVSISGICICQNRLCMLTAPTFHICFCLFPCQHPKVQKSCVNYSVTYRLLMCSP